MRIKVFCGALLLLMLDVIVLFAQGPPAGGPGEPCAGRDPDEICPLDTWVIILAVIAVTFTVIRLLRKQKLLQSANSR